MREVDPVCILIRKVETGQLFRYLRGPRVPRGYAKVIDLAVSGMARRQQVYDRNGGVLQEFNKYPMWEKARE
jgi:hypothetical protein